MDAIALLLYEHNKFRKTFTLIASRKLSEEMRNKKCRKLLHDLELHESMEQHAWYPFIPGSAKLLGHLLKEEKGAARAIKDFRKIKNETLWWNQFAKLRKHVLHHAQEEETRLFPKVRNLLSRTELKVLGQNMRWFKKSLE